MSKKVHQQETELEDIHQVGKQKMDKTSLSMNSEALSLNYYGVLYIHVV